jgi:hypothetical protein
VKQAGFRDVVRNAFKSVFISTVVVHPDHLSLTRSAFPVVKMPENTEEDFDDPEPADEGDIQTECSSD